MNNNEGLRGMQMVRLHPLSRSVIRSESATIYAMCVRFAPAAETGVTNASLVCLWAAFCGGVLSIERDAVAAYSLVVVALIQWAAILRTRD